ncbi:ligand-binding sensor domain-containing protein [Pollutibacter soli]|uniref:ligand-binding sensor domain-containing protein n=1 Tax=Pollutibacter soli TaxID=3034157 RepID=UPI003013A5FF
MLKSTFSTIFFLLFCGLSASSQSASPLVFSRITKQDGLATNSVLQTLRDQQGYLWIASQNGLQRYDGFRFLSFRHLPGDSTTIPRNTINHIYFDRKQRLWLLFDKQAGIFNTSNFHYTSIPISRPLNMIRKITELGDGRVMMIADNRQFVFNEQTKRFDSLAMGALPKGFIASDIAVDTVSGQYFFAGKNGSFIAQSFTSSRLPADFAGLKAAVADSFLSVKNSRHPFISTDGKYWLVSWLPFSGTAPKLYQFDPALRTVKLFENFRPYKSDSYYEIWSLFQQQNGTMWIYGMGLFAYYDTTRNQFVNIASDPLRQSGIEYDFVVNMYEDRYNNVWVCSNKGLYRFNADAQAIRTINNQRPGDTISMLKPVSAILETDKHEIWVSTWGSGIFSYDSLFRPISNPVKALDKKGNTLHVGGMIQLRNGDVWMGNHMGEIVVYKPSDNSFHQLAPESLKGERITQIREDGKGVVWIGTGNGVIAKSTNASDATPVIEMFRNDLSDIMKLYTDKAGNLWVGTANSGVLHLEAGSGKLLHEYKIGAEDGTGLLNEGATDILHYNDSTYIMASDALCILNIKTGKFRYLSAANGLPAEHVTTLELDDQHYLWVGLDGGLYRLNPEKELFVSFNGEDGITNDIFQVDAAVRLRDGRLAMGTSKNFIVFDPAKLLGADSVPGAFITGISIGDRGILVDSVLEEGKLQLSYNDHQLQFSLSTLQFPDHYFIYFKLDGLDKDWKQVTNDEIVYPYLPPGDYTLKLKTRNSMGLESVTESSLTIEVIPPFWRTWWFYLLLALVLGSILFWLDHERIKRKTAMLQMRSNIADDLYKDINTALGNITILSEMAKKKADREPEKSKEFIEQINTKSQNMALAMDDILWSIDPQNDSMKNFMLRFREYIDALKIQYNVQIDVLIDHKAEQLQLKMKTRNGAFSLFKSGITNVVKTGGTNCRIHITYDKPEIVYTLDYDTAEMEIERHTNLRQRVELTEKLKELHARLEYRSGKSGAGFVLKIPVR